MTYDDGSRYKGKFTNKRDGIPYQKTRDSQHKSGYLYRESATRRIFLGGYSINDNPQITYGNSNSEAGSLYKLSNNRLLIVYVESDSSIELFEIAK